MSDSLLAIYYIAIILIVTKVLGLLFRRLHLPSVLGMILGGILIGPAIWGLFIPENPIFPITNTIIKPFAEIGVILVLFSTGLETNLEQLKKIGLSALLIALGGVIIPLILGTVVGLIFVYPKSHNILSAVFIGVIMCATSVGITVESLKELGALNTKVGNIIVSAAIIDDVIGIIVLTIFMSVSNSAESSSPVLELINPNGNAIISILWMLVFFVFAIGSGILISKMFNKIAEKHPDTHRLPIYSLAICFLYAFIAEVVFGVADITGAYIAGVVLSTSHRGAMYVDKKVTVNSFMIFGPIFFAGIGMGMNFQGMSLDILWFGLAFAIVAILAKIIGCGLTAKMCKFSTKDCLKIGVGMITRGEVALVVAQRGISAGLMHANDLTIVVVLVLISSILAPILLKVLFSSDDKSLILEGENLKK